ncbi:hypothetical protein [Kineosporia sp. A_224]|uniref:hypothetical protein n=1 Tax=Kineosporia sp. A_224 TaxID=1962180 RepID=UPI000B4B3B4A|nr:hypothetical protein [Kineosporia sp. A_224]
MSLSTSRTAQVAAQHAPTECESCGRRPATGEVALEGAAPFAVCSDCAPPRRLPASEGVSAVLANTRTPDDVQRLGDLGWHGAVTLHPSGGRVVSWALKLGLPPTLALGAYAATGDPAPMVAVGVPAFLVSLTVDHHSARRHG